MNKVLMFLVLSVMLIQASPLEIGSSLSVLNSYKYETPHGTEIKVPKETKLVMITFEKSTASIVNDFLKTKNKSYLENNNVVFISDIHIIPKLLAKIFTLPKMKTFEHSVYLHYEKDFNTIVPHKKDEITLLRIKDGKITKIYYAQIKEAIQLAIEK